MKDYEVTLSIPVYNVEKYIHTALFSALNQNFESIEFLIVDDKGTDKKYGTCERDSFYSFTKKRYTDYR